MKKHDPKNDPKTAPLPSVDPLTPVPSEPALPHERDQSTDMTGGVQSEVVQQAARDLARGLEDTTRAPEADRAYKKLKK